MTGCSSLQPTSISVTDKGGQQCPLHERVAALLRHDAALRAGAVGSIDESAPGKIATELLFSHRNDAQLVLTGIAKAQPQHGTAPPNSAWRASRQALGWNKTKAPQDAGQHRITSSVDGTATSQSGGLPSSGYGNAELKSRTNACTRGRNYSGY